MKKLISVLLVIMMLLSLAACANKGGEAVNTEAAEKAEPGGEKYLIVPTEIMRPEADR